MQNNPILSICIATYNRPILLAELLDRLILQIWDKLKDTVEIVISNNNKESSETDNIVKPYVDNYSFISYHNHPEIVYFYNTIQATKHAVWKYIAVLADDDCYTDYAIPYILEIIEKTNADIIIHKPYFSEDINVSMTLVPNEWNAFEWIRNYIQHLSVYEKQYKSLISFFSFWSTLIARADYRLSSVPNIDPELILPSSFPHEYPAYFDLRDKIIVVPKAHLAIGRILNESYPGSMMLVKHFQLVMNYIEKQNDLKWFGPRHEVKSICLKGRTRTIRLWILIKKLHLDYKQNPFLKKLYFLYKRFVQ